MGILELMAAPFAECMVLVSIHTYLGIHVLRRRVIFVDLALAQIAALGTMIGFLFGVMPETTAALVVSMAFTFLGAGVFAVTRIRSERIPQEAVIGLVYAITAAIAVLVVEKTQGGEHLKEILVGCILWVKWTDVWTAAVAYTLVGILHLAFRRQFFLISKDPEEAYRRGMRVRAWDFFFYITFGFVIAFSTRVAGVLLVFVFLVAPAIMAFMITDRLLHQLLIGWAMGTVVTVTGLLLSYVLDLPSGPSVVAFYGVALALGAVLFHIVRAESRPRALGQVGAGVVCLAVIAGAFCLGASWLATTPLAVSKEMQAAQEEMKRVRAEAEAAPAERAVPSVLASTADGGVALHACRFYRSLPDAEARLRFIKKVLGRCKRGGLKLLLIFLSNPETPEFFRSEGLDLLRAATGQGFGYDGDRDPAANKAALEKLQRHLGKVPASKHSPPPRELVRMYQDCIQEC